MRGALVTLPERMQRVHTLMYFGVPSTIARTRWMFGSHLRLLTLWAWEMLLPVIGPLPQISHRCAIFLLLLEVPSWGLNFITQVALFFKYERRSRIGFFVIGGVDAPTDARIEGG
jgi:hypothetical protein